MWHEALSMHGDTHVEWLDALRGFAQKVNGVCHVGTLFSGSDMIRPMLEQLSLFWKYTYDVSLTFVFLFAAEANEGKQAFLQDHARADVVFRRAEDCSEPMAESCITGDQCIVPWVHWLWAGFPCVSKSQANTSRGQHKNCMRDATAETGRGFATVLKYVEKARPLMVTLENVTSLTDGVLGETDSDYMCERFQSLGYWSRCFITEASDHGSKAARERAYWQCVLSKQDGDGSLGIFLQRAHVATKLHCQPFAFHDFVICDDEVRAKLAADLEETVVLQRVDRGSGTLGRILKP